MSIAYPYKFSDWYGYDKDCVNFTTRYVDGPHSKNISACYQTPMQEINFTGTFGNGTTLFNANLTQFGSSESGWYNGPVTSVGSSSADIFFVNTSGVVSLYSTGFC